MDQPITGEGVFCHESGIHCAALLKDSGTYQPFNPQVVGRQKMRMVVGRHSGTRVLKHFMGEAGISISTGETQQLLASVRRAARRGQAAFSVSELVRLYRNNLH